MEELLTAGLSNEKENIPWKDNSLFISKNTNLPLNGIDIHKEGKLLDAPSCTLNDVINAFKKLLVFDDFSVIKIILATIIANRIKVDPVWLFLIGPSSSGKTEFINSLDKVPGTYMLSIVTPFLSGLRAGKGKEASLLKRLPKEFIFLQKDFTSILNMRAENRYEILAQLREIFDGKFVKETGEGTSRSWEGKAGFITGVTPEIENTIMTSTKFGDRFLYYRLPPIDEIAAMQRVSEIFLSSDNLRKDIQTKVCGYINHIIIPDTLPTLDNTTIKNLQQILQFTVKARGGVSRDNYGSKEVLSISPPEGPTRFYKEILSVAQAFLIMNNGPVTTRDMALLSRLAFCSIPSIRLSLINELYKYNDHITTKELAKAIKLPTNATRRIAEELECHGIIARGDRKSNADHWFMSEDIKKQVAFQFDAIAGVQEKKIKPPVETEIPEPGGLDNYSFNDAQLPPQ